MLRIVPFPILGQGYHRSGWPYVLESLAPILDDRADVVLDDFIERTFLFEHNYYHEYLIHRTPWVGVLHHPPNMPSWYRGSRRLSLQTLLNNNRWRESVPTLRLVVCLGDNLREWAEENLSCPCVTIRHPTGQPLEYWQPDLFSQNKSKFIVQVGTFMRNTTAIYQADCPEPFGKMRIVQARNWIRRYDENCEGHYGENGIGRKNVGTVLHRKPLSDREFDALLAQNVVFLELVDAVANNTVVECIARNTPIVINRHPSTEFYLGASYPLLYDDLAEVRGLLTTPRVMEAHEYLKSMDKTWLDGAAFRASFEHACRQHVPELREKE